MWEALEAFMIELAEPRGRGCENVSTGVSERQDASVCGLCLGSNAVLTPDSLQKSLAANQLTHRPSANHGCDLSHRILLDFFTFRFTSSANQTEPDPAQPLGYLTDGIQR